jgi:hypothetical protein
MHQLRSRQRRNTLSYALYDSLFRPMVPRNIFSLPVGPANRSHPPCNCKRKLMFCSGNSGVYIVNRTACQAGIRLEMQLGARDGWVKPISLFSCLPAGCCLPFPPAVDSNQKVYTVLQKWHDKSCITMIAPYTTRGKGGYFYEAFQYMLQYRGLIGAISFCGFSLKPSLTFQTFPYFKVQGPCTECPQQIHGRGKGKV